MKLDADWEYNRRIILDRSGVCRRTINSILFSQSILCLSIYLYLSNLSIYICYLSIYLSIYFLINFSLPFLSSLLLSIYVLSLYVQTSVADECELADLLEVLTRMCCNTEVRTLSLFFIQAILPSSVILDWIFFLFSFLQYMFLYTLKLLAKVDKNLGHEIEKEENSIKNNGGR